MSEPWEGDPSKAMQILKQVYAQRILRLKLKGEGALSHTGPRHVWQARFYDFNVWTDYKRVEKLRYMHRNPVARGLVDKPEQWIWSSFRDCLYGETGKVRVNEIDVMKMFVRPPGA